MQDLASVEDIFKKAVVVAENTPDTVKGMN